MAARGWGLFSLYIYIGNFKSLLVYFISFLFYLFIYLFMAVILFNDAELFEQIDNTPSTEGPV